mmetsp:Transcript_25396/g.43069  ORF Transcript_25396/g.43069 Transcript_25396/m.43069 type:complete len:119 (+) Transcript_25396:339-695(+)
MKSGGRGSKRGGREEARTHFQRKVMPCSHQTEAVEANLKTVIDLKHFHEVWEVLLGVWQVIEIKVVREEGRGRKRIPLKQMIILTLRRVQREICSGPNRVVTLIEHLCIDELLDVNNY